MRVCFYNHFISPGSSEIFPRCICEIVIMTFDFGTAGSGVELACVPFSRYSLGRTSG